MTKRNTIVRSVCLILALLVPPLFGLYATRLGQDTNWDLLNYHLYNGYAYVHDRLEVDLAPAGMQTYFNPFLDVALYFGVTHFRPRTVGFLLGLMQGLNFLVVYRLSCHLLRTHAHSTIYALFLALAGVLSVGFLSEVGTTFGDSLVAIFPLLSLLMIVSAIGNSSMGSRTNLLLLGAGFVSGIGCGLKLVSLIYAVAMCVAFLFVPIRWPRRISFAVLFGVSFLIGLSASGGYWMYKIWSQFGNPVFPQFNDVFKGAMAAFEPSRDFRFLPKSLFEKLYFPALFTADPTLVGELKYQQFSWIFAYVAVLGLAASRILRLLSRTAGREYWNPGSGFMVVFICFSYILWLNIFGIYRYLIPLELLIPLLLFVVVNYFMKTQSTSLGVVAFIAAVTLLNLRGVPDWGRSAWAKTIYRVEPGAMMSNADTAVVYLVGQPLAWIVPATGIRAPFIQLYPNILVSETYWKRARELASGRQGKSFVVFESATAEAIARTKKDLQHIDLTMDENNCGQLVAYLSSTQSVYKYCAVTGKPAN